MYLKIHSLFKLFVRLEDPYTYDSIELVPNEGTLTMNYNASKETVIALNVRKFESEIGGRDLVAGNNNAAANHLLPLFIYDTKTKHTRNFLRQTVKHTCRMLVLP